MTGRIVVAAGGVLWRGDPVEPEVALVHRPAYDDWSLPKGKAKPGEHVLVTALREVTEETGCWPRIGPRLTSVRYGVTSRGRNVDKVVTYWSMRSTGGGFAASREVDDMQWLSLRQARRTLTANRDKDVLDQFARTSRDTDPLLLVRHGATSAAPARGRQQRRQRLSRAGRLQAEALVPILEELGICDLLAADVPSCVETLRPAATARGLKLQRDGSLVRGDAAGPAGLADRIRAEAAHSDGLVVCGQQPVLSAVLRELGGTSSVRPPRGPAVKKGGWWLLHHRDGRVRAYEPYEPAA